MDRLYDKLISYTDGDYYPMHMPGHKRNVESLQFVNPYLVDITEIEGFDNLHQPEGILKQLSERLERLYGAGRSFPLINGSTAGILAGISASTSRGDKILIARNSHKSVYHAAMLRSLEPVYCYPPELPDFPICGGISASEIEEALINIQGIRLIVITSPTYEGVVSDIREIANIVHQHGALLLVDEAHGAHFGFHPAFPESAVRLGADLVIQSLHKTLPALTQTAVLHSNRSELNNKLQNYLAIYQSSSPSYLLMAGLDRCISLLEKQGYELFCAYQEKLQKFYQCMKSLASLKVAEGQLESQEDVFSMDPSKITVYVQDTGLTGHQLLEILRDKYHLEMEMAAPDYVLGMTSICDTQEGFTRFTEAILEIDKELTDSCRVKSVLPNNKPNGINSHKPVQVLSLQEATELKTERIKLSVSTGRISASFISLFPPGSPLIVPGELLDQELIHTIERVKQEGITVTGLTGSQVDEIEVVVPMNERVSDIWL